MTPVVNGVEEPRTDTRREPFSKYRPTPYRPTARAGSLADPFSTPLPLPARLRLRIDGRGAEGSDVTSFPGTVAPTTVGLDGARAARHAVSLGGSLLATTTIGYGASIVAARLLQAERFGRVSGAEARAALMLALLTFGFDTYARIHLSTRPDHGREFATGAIAFRAVVTAVVTVLGGALLKVLGQSHEAITLFGLFGIVQFLLQTNAFLNACLQAVGAVRGLATINLAAKLVWAILLLTGVHSGLGVRAVPIAWIVGESIRTLIIGRRVARLLSLRPSLREQQVARVLRASLPFTGGVVVTMAAQLLDVNLLSFLTTDSEVGLYRNAQTLVTIAFFVGTVIPWVLTPVAARAHERSSAEFRTVMRRGFELVLIVAVPGSVLLSLNADTVVRISGRSFDRSVPALRISAVLLIATYIVVLATTFLVIKGRTWFVVRSAIVGVVIDAVLVLAFARAGLHRWGAGGAGTAAAMAMFVAEVVVAVIVVLELGPSAWDRRSLVAMAKTGLAAVPVIVIDRILAANGFNWVRLVADVLLYGALMLLFNVVKVDEVRSQLFDGTGAE